MDYIKVVETNFINFMVEVDRVYELGYVLCTDTGELPTALMHGLFEATFQKESAAQDETVAVDPQPKAPKQKAKAQA